MLPNANGLPPPCLIIPPPPVTPQIIANTIRQFQQQNELQQPTTIPSKEAFIFHQQQEPPLQMPQPEIVHQQQSQSSEEILVEEDPKMLRAQFIIELENVEVKYQKKLLELENSSNSQRASIFRLETHNKMLTEKLEKCKRENERRMENMKQQMSKEIEQKNKELGVKTSMIEGMKKVVQHIREQLTEAKADSSSGTKVAELEQEIERKKHAIHLLAANNLQRNVESKQIRKEKNEALAQLEECRQQKAQIQAELAQKEAQIFELSQLVGDEQNLLFLAEAASKMEMLEPQPKAEQPEMIRQNSIDENSMASTTFDESNNSCVQSNSSVLMATIFPNSDTTNSYSDLPCTSSSSFGVNEPTTSAISFNLSQPADVEFVEDIKNGPPFKIKREGEEVPEKNWPTIQIDEEDRPWMSAAFRRDNQLFGRVKKEEPADDVNLVEATNQQQMEPATKNNGGRGIRRQHSYEATEIPAKRLLRECKGRINYKS